MSAALVVLALGLGATPEPPHVVIEARFLTVPADAIKLPPTPADNPAVALTDAELADLLAGLVGNKNVDVLAAPKVTTTVGQSADVMVGDQVLYVTGMDVSVKDNKPVCVPKTTAVFVGLKAQFLPTLAADRGTVRLAVDLSHTTAADKSTLVPFTYFIAPVSESGAPGKPVPFTQFLQMPPVDTNAVKTVVDLPAGRTVVLPFGSRVVETRSEFGPPVLSKIPYVNRMFKNVGVGRESRNVYLTLTARVAE